MLLINSSNVKIIILSLKLIPFLKDTLKRTTKNHFPRKAKSNAPRNWKLKHYTSIIKEKRTINFRNVKEQGNIMNTF